jgi:hypothetical protein
MDPRVKTPLAGLQQQFSLSRRLTDMLRADRDLLAQVRALRVPLRAAREAATKGGRTVSDSVDALDKKAAALEGQGGGFGGGAGSAGEESLGRLNTELASLLSDVQEADLAPTAAMTAATAELERALRRIQARWTEIRR